MLKIVKIREVGGSLVISLPKKVLFEAGLESGDDVLIQSGMGVAKGTINVRKAEPIVGKREKKDGKSI